ncbi:MAG: hypothetical protein GX608_13725 [Lentisphaerae bacterium]|nr:hypothetical protein [Lentisphaerota bacterium]
MRPCIPILALALASAMPGPARSGPGTNAAELEPTFNGEYLRIMADHGDLGLAYEWADAYPKMKEAGVNAIYSYQLFPNEQAAKKHGMTPDEYIARSAGWYESHGFQYWACGGILDSAAPLGRVVGNPLFRGVANDEPSAPGPKTQEDLAAFKDALLKKYAPEQLRAMGLGELLKPGARLVPPLVVKEMTKNDALRDPALVVPMPASYKDNPVLHMEYEEYACDKFVRRFAEQERIMRAARPDSVSFPIFSFMTLLHAPFRSSLARVGRVSGAISVDFYSNGSQEAGFWAKLMRNQARGPSFLTLAAGKYSYGSARFARDLATGAVHSPAVLIWAWVYAQHEAPPAGKAGTSAQIMRDYYRPGNYDVMSKTFRRIEKIQPYLVPSASTAKIALIYSERESMWDQAGVVAWARAHDGFVGHCYLLHCALGQLGVQYEPVFEELIDPGELARYQVVILPGIGYISPETRAALDAWVKAGGSLVVLGRAGHKDRWGRPQETSALADLAGAECREYRHARGFDARFGTNAPLFVAYNKDLPAFKLDCGSAQTLGKWEDGSAAFAVNALGRGRVYSVGAQAPAANVIMGGAESSRRMIVDKYFLPGIMEFLDGLLREAMGSAAGEQPFQAAWKPSLTEVTVRRQAGRNIVHLINYLTGDAPVTGARVTIRVPAGTKPVVFYPETMSRAKYDVQGRDVIVEVRDFDVHEVFVVQYDGAAPELKEQAPGSFILPGSFDEAKKGRGVAYFGPGAYPGAAVAKAMNIPVHKYVPILIDQPFDFAAIARRNFMICVNLKSVTRTTVQRLGEYVREGGVLHLVGAGAGRGADEDRTYVQDSGAWAAAATSQFEQIAGGVLNHEAPAAAGYLNRIRPAAKHPIVKNLAAGEWLELKPGELPAGERNGFVSGLFGTNNAFALLEGELGREPADQAPVAHAGTEPVVLLIPHGKGWILWDATAASRPVTCNGPARPVFNTLASNVLEWAASAAQ